MAELAVLVSGHGFGHATRTRALLQALLAARPGTTVEVRSDGASWPFEGLPGVSFARAEPGPGLVQLHALQVDYDASFRAHERFASQWDRRVAAEAAALRESGARLVVGDIPPLAFAAADAAGLPSAAVANFSWEWILADYARREPRWRPFVELYARAYAKAGRLFRLPLHGPDDFASFPRVEDAPLLVRKSPLSKDESRARLGLSAETRPVVLFGFGGYAPPAGAARGDDLSGFVFVGHGAAPPGLSADWRPVPAITDGHLLALSACDAVIGKLGYGTVSEILAHERPLVFAERSDFAEIPVLEAAVLGARRGRALTREDFLATRWRAALESALADAGARAPPSDGAQRIAAALAASLG